MSIEDIVKLIFAIVVYAFASYLKYGTKKDRRQSSEIKNIINHQKNTHHKSANMIKSVSDNKKNEQNIKKALSCPNCGAPLTAIYERCKYCGMSYKEAKDTIQSMSNGEEDTSS